MTSTSAALLDNDLVSQLAEAGEHLPDEISNAIIARGSEVVPKLLAILENEQLAEEGAVGDGFVPCHAADLLAKLDALEAVGPMFTVLKRCDIFDILYSKLIFALRSFGPQILEHTIKAYSNANTTDQRHAVIDIMAGLAVRDERIFPILLGVFKKDQEFGAISLAGYGDPAAIPYISSALDSCKLPKNRGSLEQQKIIELAYAIEKLGGTLTESQKAKLEDARNLIKNSDINSLFQNFCTQKNDRLLDDAVKATLKGSVKKTSGLGTFPLSFED